MFEKVVIDLSRLEKVRMEFVGRFIVIDCWKFFDFTLFRMCNFRYGIRYEFVAFLYYLFCCV